MCLAFRPLRWLHLLLSSLILRCSSRYPTCVASLVLHLLPWRVPSALREEDPAQGFPGGRAFRTLRRAAGFSDDWKSWSINLSSRSFSVRVRSNTSNCLSFSRPRPLQPHELPPKFLPRPLQHHVQPLTLSLGSRPSQPLQVVPSPRKVAPATARLSRARTRDRASILTSPTKKWPFGPHRISDCCLQHPSIAAETKENFYQKVHLSGSFFEHLKGEWFRKRFALSCVLVLCASPCFFPLCGKNFAFLFHPTLSCAAASHPAFFFTSAYRPSLSSLNSSICASHLQQE